MDKDALKNAIAIELENLERLVTENETLFVVSFRVERNS